MPMEGRSTTSEAFSDEDARSRLPSARWCISPRGLYPTELVDEAFSPTGLQGRKLGGYVPQRPRRILRPQVTGRVSALTRARCYLLSSRQEASTRLAPEHPDRLDRRDIVSQQAADAEESTCFLSWPWSSPRKDADWASRRLTALPRGHQDITSIGPGLLTPVDPVPMHRTMRAAVHRDRVLVLMAGNGLN